MPKKSITKSKKRSRSRSHSPPIMFYIYIESYSCKSCIEIRSLLDTLPYEEIIVNNENSEYIFKKIDRYTYGKRELPIIFIDDIYIGDIEDLKILLKIYNKL